MFNDGAHLTIDSCNRWTHYYRVMIKRTAFILGILALAIALAVAPASAKKKSGFKTGTYKATGDVAFKFKVYKGTCYSKGKKKAGYCVSGIGSPPQLALDCPDVKDGVRDHTSLGFVPNQRYLPKSGKIKISFRNPVRTDEWDDHRFTLTVKKNGRASGSMSLSATVKSLKVQSTCLSGVKKFSAKR